MRTALFILFLLCAGQAFSQEVKEGKTFLLPAGIVCQDLKMMEAFLEEAAKGPAEGYHWLKAVQATTGGNLCGRAENVTATITKIIRPVKVQGKNFFLIEAKHAENGQTFYTPIRTAVATTTNRIVRV